MENKKSLSEPPWALRGNVRTPSIARLKAHGQLPFRHYWTFFAISYGWNVISGNMLKSTFFERGGSFWTKISDRWGVVHQTLLVSETRVIVLSCGVKISAVHCLVLSQSTRVTDRHTDGQNYDSQHRASIAARAVKTMENQCRAKLSSVSNYYYHREHNVVIVSVAYHWVCLCVKSNQILFAINEVHSITVH